MLIAPQLHVGVPVAAFIFLHDTNNLRAICPLIARTMVAYRRSPLVPFCSPMAYTIAPRKWIMRTTLCSATGEVDAPFQSNGSPPLHVRKHALIELEPSDGANRRSRPAGPRPRGMHRASRRNQDRRTHRVSTTKHQRSAAVFEPAQQKQGSKTAC